MQGTARETTGKRGGSAGSRGLREGSARAEGPRRAATDEPRVPRASPASPPRPALPSRFPGASPALPRNAADDSGALLLLAGFILGVALIVTGLTLSEVAQLENEAVREQDASFIAEFRSLRDKMGTALYDSVTSTTDIDAFEDTFDNIADSFRSLETTRGFGFVSVLASGNAACSTSVADTAECSAAYTVPSGCASGRSFRTNLAYADGSAATEIRGQCWDGVNDGIVKLGTGTTIKGAFVYVHLDDPAFELDEVVLYELN